MFVNIYVGDFENTTGGNETYVYGAGFISVTDSNDQYHEFFNIDDAMNYILSLPKNSVVYFHNGSNYDANLIIYWLLHNGYVFTEDKNVRKRFYGIITAEGKVYNLKIRAKNHNVEIRDTCLLMQGTLSYIGSKLGCPTAKLTGTIDYDKPRSAGYVMDDTEREYLKHDVMLLKEIVQVILTMGDLPNYLTAGGFAFNELRTSLYKTLHRKTDDEMNELKLHPKFKQYTQNTFRHIFPEIPVAHEDLMRHAYRGGWCYNNTHSEVINDNGLVLDVNSLYPSVMKNHEYPYGEPRFYVGNRVPASGNDWLDSEIEAQGVTVDKTHVCKCYIVEIQTTFTLKDKHVPCIQLKGNSYFVPTEYAKTTEYIDEDGDVCDDEVTIWLCSADLELFFEQYDVHTFIITRGFEFSSYDHFFDDFVDSHYELKKNAPNKVIRQTAKIILNSSYGGFCQRIRKKNAIVRLDADGVIVLDTQDNTKYPQRTYTPVGVFCTAYARQVTVRTAQMFYDNFCYSDTDSVHLRNITLDEVKQHINIDPVELGYWACEGRFCKAVYVRAKTYCELLTHADEVELKTPTIDIKACGLTDEGKDMLKKRDDLFDIFTFGLKLDKCKLMKHRVVGGVNLTRRDWQIKG